MSGEGKAVEIPQSAEEKQPVSCLTDWHYSLWERVRVRGLRLLFTGLNAAHQVIDTALDNHIHRFAAGRFRHSG
ncbi:hypothetical protein SESI111939_21505 [Serratia silvae]